MRSVTLGSILNRITDEYGLELEIHTARGQAISALKAAKSMPKIKKIALATVSDYKVHLEDAVDILAVIDYDRFQGFSTRGLAFPGYGMHPWIISEDQYVEVEEPKLTPEDIYEISQYRGPYAKYEEDLPFLTFNEDGKEVIVVYNGIQLDGNNLPKFPDYTEDYIINSLLLMEYRKMFIHRQVTMGELQEVERWRGTAARQMRKIPTSKNVHNEIFDVLTSFDRKSFNIPI